MNPNERLPVYPMTTPNDTTPHAPHATPCCHGGLAETCVWCAGADSGAFRDTPPFSPDPRVGTPVCSRMDKTEYDEAMSNAQGDADIMLGACVRRIKSLEELLDRAKADLAAVREYIAQLVGAVERFEEACESDTEDPQPFHDELNRIAACAATKEES